MSVPIVTLKNIAYSENQQKFDYVYGTKLSSKKKSNALTTKFLQ